MIKQLGIKVLTALVLATSTVGTVQAQTITNDKQIANAFRQQQEHRHNLYRVLEEYEPRTMREFWTLDHELYRLYISIDQHCVYISRTTPKCVALYNEYYPKFHKLNKTLTDVARKHIEAKHKGQY